ncbi:hypothetical protein [uncultured Methanobrevibacter sp.]|uniref:hypothetical protein n=1 Tax=uncultured Methanobrevibacter sp. TaxID=253161 RepID=UPI00262DBA57
MKLINLKWGYDGGGMACGPVAGATIAEIECEDENGDTYFVHISRCGTYPAEYVVISKDSGIEDAVNQEWDNIMAYKESSNNTVFDYEIGDYPEDIFKSRFIDVIRLTQMAVFEAVSQNPTQQTADIWFAPYKGKDTSECDIEDLYTEKAEAYKYVEKLKDKIGDNQELLDKLNEIVCLFEANEDWGLFLEYVEYYSSLDVSKFSEEFDEDIAKIKSW